MGSIYLPYQKPPRWNIDPDALALNCARMGLPVPRLLKVWGSGDQWVDVSRNRNTGVCTGSWIGGAVDFVAGYDNVGLVPALQIAGDITVVVRFYPRSFNDACIFACHNWTGNSEVDNCLYAVDFQPGGLRSFWEKGAGVNVIDTWNFVQGTDIVLNKWQTLVFVREKTATSKIKFYIDGILKYEQAGLDHPTGGSNSVTTAGEVHGNPTPDYFDCLMNTWQIYAYAFTDAQVATISQNLYGMVEPIRSPATWKVPPVGGLSIPIAMHHYNQLRLG